jgi:hypothetical protein
VFALFAVAKAVIAPGTLYLVTITLTGGAEAIKVAFGALNGANNIGLGHTTGLDAVLFGDAANSLDMHDVPYPD